MTKIDHDNRHGEHKGQSVNGFTSQLPSFCLHHGFEAIADRYPENAAIIYGESIITYAQLEHLSNQLAHALISHHIRAEEPVGVLVERSGFLPLAFLAILKAGGAYVPMVADLPAQRLANIARQANMRHLIALDGLTPAPELQAVLEEHNGGILSILRPDSVQDQPGTRPSRLVVPTDLAAILFTSGSTGQPKGVMLQHDGCINMVQGHLDAHAITSDDRILLSAAPGFILGFRELCLPLLAGAAYVPVTRQDLNDPQAVLALMERHRVTIGLFTPSYLRLFQGKVPAGLRAILTAGERPNTEDARRYARTVQYWNVHGATEVCGTICMHLVDPDGEGTLPSGRPFQNTAVYLLDAQGQVVPSGETGEIHVVGAGVARGYLNQPELTAASFVQTPYGRAYRAGDLARWRPDGTLEALGRADDVVKVSGQSVSLGEIERTLQRHPAVSHAAVLQHQGTLVAFVECPAATAEDWRLYLSVSLPGYMMPAQVVAVSHIPVNASGKVDRQALPGLIPAPQVITSAPPEGPVEQAVAAIWAEALDLPAVGRHDNFFALGGTSLRAIAISQHLQAAGYAVTVPLLLVAGTVAALAERLADLSGLQDDDQPETRITSGQEDFWIAAQLGLAPSTTQITRFLRVQGPCPPVEQWQAVWQTLLDRHSALRTAFYQDDSRQVHWRQAELADLPADAALCLDQCPDFDTAQACIARHIARPFDLTRPPLAHAGIVQTPDETLFWFALHHAVVDGLSARILQEELYALLQGQTLPAVGNGVALASAAEYAHAASPRAAQDRAFWQEMLGALARQQNGEAFEEFATDFRRPASPSGQAAPLLVERLDATVTDALTRIAQAHQVGLHALLLTLLGAEARRRSNRQNVLIGTAMSTRPPRAERAVGLFVNLLPLPLGEGTGLTLSDQISATQNILSAAMDHAGTPSGHIFRDFRRHFPHARPHSRISIFDISLTANTSRISDATDAAFSLYPRPLPALGAAAATGIDLAFNHEPDGSGGILLNLAWNPDLYLEDTARSWLQAFAWWARWLAADPARTGGALPALLPDEDARLTEWEQGPALSVPALRFHQIFEAQVDTHPQRTAIVTETGTISYAELDRQANGIAHLLLLNGLRHEEPVAVLTDSSVDLPAAALGIWKAGGTYLPLSVEQPPERLAHMMRDSQAHILIVLDNHPVPTALAALVSVTLRPDGWEPVEQRPHQLGEPGDLAYLIYTSGTTGRPKGVGIHHAGYVNTCFASQATLSCTADDCVALVATPSFDASLWELGLGLLQGGSLAPITKALRDNPWAMKAWYEKVGVTIAFHAPSYLRISKQEPFRSLRILIAGGEAPTYDDARAHISPTLSFWNGYGPTEASIASSINPVSLDADPDAPLPIGRPLPNTSMSIRRADGQRLPPGSIGEIWLGGPGIARGYLHNPDLTAERFVSLPGEGRLYRSGDLGYWRADGQMVIRGRIDHQVKLHGQRLELGEIENALTAHPAVDDATVLVDVGARGTKVLRAFVRLHLDKIADGTLSADGWREFLSDYLPPYMIPATVTVVRLFPVTAAGKVDRTALLSLVDEDSGEDSSKTAPHSAMERRIAALWSDILKVTVHREDNFFALGGNSLLAVTIAYALSQDLEYHIPARALFAAPTLAQFAQRVEQYGTTQTAITTSINATAGQTEFWIAEQAGLEMSAFTIPLLRQVVGPMPSPDQWQAALEQVVARHPSLRTSFVTDHHGTLTRQVHPQVPVTLEWSVQPDQTAARTWIRQRQGQPLSMRTAPLWRAGLVSVPGIQTHFFWMALHHAVGDGRSLGLLVADLNAVLQGQPLPSLNDGGTGAQDGFDLSAGREEAYMSSPAFEEDARFWHDTLKRIPDAAMAEWSLDYARAAQRPPQTHRFAQLLPPATAQGLKALAQHYHASPHAVILTLLAVEARRRSGRQDLVIGTTASTRETAGEDQVAGYYVNMLPLSCHLPPQASFGSLLQQVQQMLATSLQHGRYPFARMYGNFWSARPQHRDPSRFPLFDLTLSENSEPQDASGLLRPPAPLPYELSQGAPGQDMILLHDARGSDWMLHWQVNAALYRKETAAAWFQSLLDWAGWLADDIGRADQPLPALLPHEARLLADWEHGPSVPVSPLAFHQIAERWSDATPDHPAVMTPDLTQSYAQLDRRANGVAAALLRTGLQHQDTVAVLAECSADLAAVVLGIWKAGGIYLPLAAKQPPERLAHMMRDAEASVLVVCDGVTLPAALASTAATILQASSLPESLIRPHGSGTADDLAYIIYTSGTTGLPKGVAISHKNAIHIIGESARKTAITAADRIALVATPSFDASLWELGLGLLHGGVLVPVSHALRDDPWAMKEYYAKMGVTVAFHAPSYLRISKNKPFTGLRVLLVGGEAATHDDVRGYGDTAAFWHAYGPTETTIIISLEHLPTASLDPGKPLPVGRPLANTRISIRHEDGQPVPPGVTGEVWLGGIGLAAGYLNNPDLTAERFVQTADGLFYRSGDLGCWSESGSLIIRGRIDHQIKLHGQRLELGEIAEALNSLPHVSEALVLVDKAANDTKVLRAFVCLEEGALAPSDEEWQAHLADRLPRYMIPVTLTPIPVIPVTSSGKVDRQALLAQVSGTTPQDKRHAPRGPVESLIADVWSELLGQTVCREDNFFALGGNSLLAVAVAHRLSERLNLSLPARDLFTAPTLSGYAARISERTRPDGEDAAPVLEPTALATEGELEFWVAEQAGLNTAPFLMPLCRRVAGTCPAIGQWNDSWAVLTARHEALRTRYDTDEQGRLFRVITDVSAPALEEITLPDRTSAMTHIRQRQSQPLPLTEAPLWRGGLVHITQSGETLLWQAMHHAVGDGRSQGVLLDELATLLVGGSLPPSEGSYSLSAARSLAYLSGPEQEEDARYWQNTLNALPDAAFGDWALDMPRSQTAAPGCHRLQSYLPPTVARGLKAIARAHNSSLHAVMLTLLALETRRRTGRSAVLVGTPADMRETAEENRVVGYYVNMLPLALQADAGSSFAVQLRQTQQDLAAAITHGRMPFARIYNDFRQQRPLYRHPTRYPLFDLAVNENPAGRPGTAPLRFLPPTLGQGHEIDYERVDISPGQDMVLIHELLPDGMLMLQLQVNAALYTQETATAWFNSLRWWAEWLCDDPVHVRNPLPRLLPREEALLAGWEHGPVHPRPQQRLHELFDGVVDRLGVRAHTHLAVLSADLSLTYAQLEQDANRLAHALRALHVPAGAIVGVLTGRSAALPAAVLGIWKAGATYLPLATDMPAERLCYMVSNAAIAQLVVLDGVDVPPKLAELVPPPLRPETLPPGATHRPVYAGDPEDGAYIIYTSGSTGQPKGTLISHRSYVNMVLGAGDLLEVTEQDRCLMFASPSFDVSLSDLGVPLLFGATLCPVPRDIINAPSQFLDFLNTTGITVADITPTYLRLFDGADLPSVRMLITGGEAPFPADISKYADRLRYFNAYGPTENTITCAMGLLTPAHSTAPSCGRPLPNTSIHICDPDGNPVPPGVIGELWLGGMGLAKGYLGRDDLTALNFVDTPYGRRYRSGDLGRWRVKLPSASSDRQDEVQFLGRRDSQIKLNGIRIELGEIEHVLDRHPAVAQAVVLAESDAGTTQKLWAFVRLRPDIGLPGPDDQQWRDYLSDHLPAAMIPAGVLVVDTIPVNSSGKVDGAALLALLAGRPADSQTADLPVTAMEQHVAALWAEMLKLSHIQRTDNFFGLGGHSLLAIAMVQRLSRSLNRPLATRDLFAHPVLSAFAAHLEQTQPAPLSVVDPDLVSMHATEGQREFWTAEQAGRDTKGLNLTLTLTAQGRPVSAADWQRAWSTLVQRHPALRTAFIPEHEQGDNSAAPLLRHVLPHLDAPLPVTHTTSLAAAQALIRQAQVVTLPMNQAPLWRAGVVEVDENRQTLFWLALHHAIGDGMSLGILVQELTLLLRQQPLPVLTGDFNRHAGQAEAYLNSGPARAADAAFWQQALDSLGQTLDGELADASGPFDEWPLDFARSTSRSAAEQTGTSHVFRVALDPSTAQGLRSFARQHGASLHALMLSLMALEVWRRTERPDFVLGTAASTRTAEDADLVQYFVTMLPLPCRLRPGTSVEQLLNTMQQTLGDALQHSAYPFARIYQDFRQRHPQTVHPTRYPLFDLAVTENPAMSPPAPASGASPLRLVPLLSPPDDTLRYELRSAAPPQDMVLVHEALSDGGLGLSWHVNADLYEQETARSWILALIEWAHHLTSGQRLPHTPLPPLTRAETRQLGQWQSGPRTESAPHFPTLFQDLARQFPDAPALVTASETLSYGQIDASSTGLARLLQEAGVAPGVTVGVLSGRSPALAPVVLAIWKAGGCYVPLSVELPPSRLGFIARDAAVQILLVLDGLDVPPEITAPHILRPQTLSLPLSAPAVGRSVTDSDPAYIIYTSGSTGQPKGVVVSVAGYDNFCAGMSQALDMTARDRVLQMSSPSFDAWLSDLALAWANGGALAPLTRAEIDDSAGLARRLQALGVTVATMPPSYLALQEKADLPGLRLLMTVGEPPLRSDALHYASRLRYLNGYGPSEASICTNVGLITPASRKMTVGRPLSNVDVHLWNKHRQPVPPGAVGQIWIGGVAVAPGYLNRPDLTAQRFLQTDAGRCYDSGDLGRWSGTGELEVLGRVDTQVKLRGQRIELEEIEHQIDQHTAVLQAVVAIHQPAAGTPSLWGFVCLRPDAVAPSMREWRSLLTRTLPGYMIPARIFTVDAIPLSPSGKVDRKALLAAHLTPQMADALSAEGGQEGRTLPMGRTEEQIATVWGEIFPGRTLYREDNFFELGGHSLSAIAVANRLRSEFTCTINDLYEHPVLADFARICQPRHEHLQDVLGKAKAHWLEYRATLTRYEEERHQALTLATRAYETRNQDYLTRDLTQRRHYDSVVLTGATGYVGSYLLRDLLTSGQRRVTALVRGSSAQASRARLEQVLHHYFGAKAGSDLAHHPRLQVLSADLRRPDLGLEQAERDYLSATGQAIFHCAANVKHFGHYEEFQKDNVDSVRHLLTLATHRAADPMDLHLVSTMSVAGRAPETGFHLFTEYHPTPDEPCPNYYVRTKQEAERLLISARDRLNNGSIYRVGNVVFASDGTGLQMNLKENAFFRMVASLLRLGVAPDDTHAWLCHVDLVSRSVLTLAETAALRHETHHLEHSRQDVLAEVIAAGAPLEISTFGGFIDTLSKAVDDPARQRAFFEAMDGFGLYSGQSPHPRARRLEPTSARTNALLARLGLVWPALSLPELTRFLTEATRYFDQN